MYKPNPMGCLFLFLSLILIENCHVNGTNLSKERKEKIRGYSRRNKCKENGKKCDYQELNLGHCHMYLLDIIFVYTILLVHLST